MYKIKEKERRKNLILWFYSLRNKRYFSRSSGERGTKQAWSERQFCAGLLSPDKRKKKARSAG